MDNYMGSGVYLKRALNKYGRKNFKKEILEYCSKNNWQERERYWIEKMETYKSGYNLTLGGEGLSGIIFSEEVRLKMKMTRIERGLAKGENNGMFGNRHRIESRRKMGKTKKQTGVCAGKNNSRFDHNIYKFKNKVSGEIFEGHKFDLAKKIGSLSCHLDAVIRGRRNHHKNWILV